MIEEGVPMKRLSVVVPAYNEEEVLPHFYEEITKVCGGLNEQYDYELLFVDDGSKDGTLAKLKELHSQDDHVKYVSFSRNFGKESAMLAGLTKASGDLVVMMDADLQHDPGLIPEMLKYIEEGYDTVTTVRDRKGEPFLRSLFSSMFYKVMKSSEKVQLEQNSQDFRMMTRKVVDAILELKEYNRFSKGIFSWVGFKTKYISVNNRKREFGSTKWSFRGLVSYSIDGITSFSEKPLKLATTLGIFITILSIISAIVLLIQTLGMEKELSTIGAVLTAVFFMGGIQLMTIGIVSTYVGKIYLETKERPVYIIREELL